MKKTLIALAALGMAAGAAQASNVTIYGQLQPSYDFVEVKETVSNDQGTSRYDEDITTMSNNNSRIGFKGSEDLGNGLQAIFKLESKFDMVDGGGFVSARDTYLGLKGDFGTVMVGNIDSVYKSISAKYDSFSDTIGDYNSIMGQYLVYPGDADQRYPKTAKYISPCMNGVKLMANYTLVGAANHVNGEWGVGATYDNGPLNVLFAYEKISDNYIQELMGGGADNVQNPSAWKVGASYQIDDVTLKAIFEKGKVDGESLRNFYLGVDYKVNSSTTLMAHYMDANERTFNYDNGIDSTTVEGADAWSVGVDYKLSKRTSIQGIYTDFDISGYEVDSTGTTSGKMELSGFSVRLQHKF